MGSSFCQPGSPLSTNSLPSSQCDPGSLGQHGEYPVCPAGGGRDPGHGREREPDSARQLSPRKQGRSGGVGDEEGDGKRRTEGRGSRGDAMAKGGKGEALVGGPE